MADDFSRYKFLVEIKEPILLARMFQNGKVIYLYRDGTVVDSDGKK